MKYLAFILVAFLVIGCSKEAVQTYMGKTEIRLPDGTEVKTTSEGYGKVTAPENASSPSNLQVGPSGTQSTISGVFEKSINEILAGDNWIYTVACLACIIGGIAVIWFAKQYVLGGILIVTGPLIAALPYVLPQIGTMLLVIIGLMFVSGIVFLIAKYVLKIKIYNQAIPGISKLHREGKHNEAVAAERAVNPKLDKAFKETK